MRYEIVVRRPWAPGCIVESVEKLTGLGLDVFDAFVERSADKHWAEVHLHVLARRHLYRYDLERHLDGIDGYELLRTRDG
jgi:hypothetical protein